mmetsp:Transcript_10961/g.21785  ORF Transcript_10961/g.21785 Transcript_10961/m.21785 type:complete len:230 (-) Transcript_10961:1612-2301(-)
MDAASCVGDGETWHSNSHLLECLAQRFHRLVDLVPIQVLVVVVMAMMMMMMRMRRRRRRRMREGGERKQRSRDDVAVVWFRDGDLRIRDNEALYAAVESGRRVIPLFIWSDEEQGKWGVCGAARFWLSRGLQSLDDDLRQKYGSRLVLVKTNDTTSEIIKILKATKASALFFNASYTPDIMRRDDTCVEEINKEKQAQKRRKKNNAKQKGAPPSSPESQCASLCWQCPI